MFLSFVVTLTGIGDFSLLWMLIVQVIIVVILGGIYLKNRSRPRVEDPLSDMQLNNPPSIFNFQFSIFNSFQKILIIILTIWIITKLIAGAILLSGPAYFDDTISNWNLRGKMFYVQQDLVLEVEPGKVVGVSSYPQAVSLIKTWLAHLNGSWNEVLVNSIHLVWYLCLLGLVFFALRRLVDLKWSLVGTYILASLPLMTMHGVTAYADLMLALHIFLALMWLFFAVRSKGNERLSYLKLGAVATALLIYTKNEALLLHLPPIVLLLVVTIILQKFNRREIWTTLFWYSVSIAFVILPWLYFKWSNSLGFGNAKDLSNLSIAWQEGVLRTIWQNTLFEGNWSLFPVLFVGLLIARWRSAFGTSLILLTAFFWMVWLGQLPIYMFTGLSTEVLMQTGYARGIVHLMPVAVLVATVLLADICHDRKSS